MRRIIALTIILILVGATVAYVGVNSYLSYNSPSAKCQREASQGDSQVGVILVIPALKVQFGTSSGVFTVRLSGSACSTITGFTITSISPLVSGVVGASFVRYQGDLISGANPEPISEPASGSIPVSNVTIGQSYSFTYAITEPPGGFSSGTNNTTVTFTAAGYTLVTIPLAGNITSAVNYLTSTYNPHLGLIPETPNSSAYWLYSDNFLAAWALSQYPNASAAVAHTAANISQSISDYHLGNIVNQYEAMQVSSSCVFHAANNYTVSSSGGVQIKVIVNNGTGILNHTQYADIAFLDALCQNSHGNTSAALAAYNIGAKMFDGTGLRDLPYNQTQQYQTYKLALFIFAAADLNQPINLTALSTLLRMQAASGGFYTGYDAGYSHGTTMTNTETTSLALLALEMVVNQEPG